MTEQTIMVWDLESIPDLKAASRMLSMPDAPENELENLLERGFRSTPSTKSFASEPSLPAEPPRGGKWRRLAHRA
jgi:hypothetical protein